MHKWYVYIVRCADQTLYTGITTNVERRFAEHSSQGSKAAKYVRGRLPLKLVFKLNVATRSIAASLEYQIKNLSKAQKELLIKKPKQAHNILLLCQHN